jgi:hypothetical protein
MKTVAFKRDLSCVALKGSRNKVYQTLAVIYYVSECINITKAKIIEDEISEK